MLSIKIIHFFFLILTVVSFNAKNVSAVLNILSASVHRISRKSLLNELYGKQHILHTSRMISLILNALKFFASIMSEDLNKRLSPFELMSPIWWIGYSLINEYIGDQFVTSDEQRRKTIWHQVNIYDHKIKLSRVFESRLPNCHVNANQNVRNHEKKKSKWRNLDPGNLKAT